MPKKKIAVADFKRYKEEGKKYTFVTAYDYTTASIVNDSETEIILVGDSAAMVMLGRNSTVGMTMEEMIGFVKPVVLGAPDTFVIGDMPFGSYNVSPEQAIENCNKMLMKTNCDAVKLEGGVHFAPTIRRLTDAGIPVVGHIGLTPQTATSLGGFRVQGGTPESAAQLIEDARKLEEAGAIAIVIECVPSVVGKAVTEAVKIPIWGIGAGPDVDCQVLVTQDALGMYKGMKPKFVKHFAHIREAMVEGLNAFHEETLEGTFPSPEYAYNKAVDIPKLY